MNNMNDDELRQAMATYELLKKQLDAMSQQLNFFQLSLEETMRAYSTLDAFAKAKEGEEILVPAGASSFVKATITSERKAIVGIGNKISVDMDIEAAAEYMKTSGEEVQAAIKKLSETISETDTKAKALAVSIQNEYDRRQK
jgi:prefoldin alpha subunit